MSTSERGGTKMLLLGEIRSEMLSIVSLNLMMAMMPMMMTMMYQSATTAQASTLNNASGVMSMLYLSKIKKAAVHATPSQPLKFLSLTLLLQVMVLLLFLSSRSSTAVITTPMAATVDGPHLSSLS